MVIHQHHAAYIHVVKHEAIAHGPGDHDGAAAAAAIPVCISTSMEDPQLSAGHVDGGILGQ